MRIPREIRFLFGIFIMVLVSFLTTFLLIRFSFPSLLQPTISSIMLELYKSLIQLDGVLFGFAILTSTLIFRQIDLRKKTEKLRFRFNVFLIVISALTCFGISIVYNILAIVNLASNRYEPNILLYSLSFTLSGILLTFSEFYILLIYVMRNEKI